MERQDPSTPRYVEGADLRHETDPDRRAWPRRPRRSRPACRRGRSESLDMPAIAAGDELGGAWRRAAGTDALSRSSSLCRC
jgi:hypothetical protein